jgi:hypothetical protein
VVVSKPGIPAKIPIPWHCRGYGCVKGIGKLLLVATNRTIIMGYFCDKCAEKMLSKPKPIGDPVRVSKPFIVKGKNGKSYRKVRFYYINGAVKVTTNARYIKSLFEEIPKDHIVCHKDGDTLNDDINNLAVVSRQEIGNNLVKKYLKKHQYTVKPAKGIKDALVDTYHKQDKRQLDWS